MTTTPTLSRVEAQRRAVWHLDRARYTTSRLRTAVRLVEAVTGLAWAMLALAIDEDDELS